MMRRTNVLLAAGSFTAITAQILLVTAGKVPLQVGGGALGTFALFLAMRPLLRLQTWWHALALSAGLALLYTAIMLAVPGDDWLSIGWVVALALVAGGAALAYRRRFPEGQHSRA